MKGFSFGPPVKQNRFPGPWLQQQGKAGEQKLANTIKALLCGFIALFPNLHWAMGSLCPSTTQGSVAAWNCPQWLRNFCTAQRLQDPFYFITSMEELGIGGQSLKRSRLHQALSDPGSQSFKNQQDNSSFCLRWNEDVAHKSDGNFISTLAILVPRTLRLRSFNKTVGGNLKCFTRQN